MKKSKYTIFFNGANGTRLAFNFFTCQLSEVYDDFMLLYENIEQVVYTSNCPNSSLIRSMIEGGYVIDNSIDELEILKMRYYSGKCDSSSFSLIIAPTMDCNFGCPYCYETRQTTYLSNEVEDRIVAFVSGLAASVRKINVVWYGGEPLLAYSIISRMSAKMIEACQACSTEYTATMISNGYLFDRIDISTFKELKINNVQITVDGPEEIHNKRRYLINKHLPTFSKIIANLHLLESHGIMFNIRINVDNTNINHVDELLAFLKDNQLDSHPVSFGHIREFNRPLKELTKDLCSKQQYTNINMILHSKLIDLNFTSARIICPQIKKTYCAANCLQSLVIDPGGDLYKCWNDIGYINKSVGNILTSESGGKSQYNDYTLFNPFSDCDCVDCIMLPVCMGGCVFDRMNSKSFKCMENINNVIVGLLDAYSNIDVRNV